MLAGERYDALDPELVSAHYRVRDLCQKLNGSRDADENLRRDLCRQIFGQGGETVWMQPPFYCEYGSNIELGERVIGVPSPINPNCALFGFRSDVRYRTGPHAGGSTASDGRQRRWRAPPAAEGSPGQAAG